jgi:hypothetical protein
MPHITSPNERIFGPLPRRDILAICAFLNRSEPARRVDECSVAEESMLNRLAAAARMQ